ncbi:MAG: hypothetical protein MUE69_23215 [Myxococcota bacterium]|nr:hypothetical protein [Myxococcota bacterium]
MRRDIWRRFVAVGALSLCSWAIGCGGDDLATEVEAVATLEPVRGEGALARVGTGERTEVAGLARLSLDVGSSALLSGTAFTISAEGELAIEGGRAFVEVPAGDALTIALGDARLFVRDAAISIEGGPLGSAGSAADGRVHVLRGEVAYRSGESRGRVRAGEHLTIADLRVASDVLWEDWTGGLARTGPGVEDESAIGALTGRIPDEVGLARWPLVVRRMDVNVRVVGDLAITEIEQEYFNPASEVVEGLYRLRVPEGAVLQRFAVDRDGRLVDGYVREKQQAEAAYEAQVYRGSTLDPALLEWIAPGEYQARIYPIAPGATRKIAVRWASWLERPSADGPALYRLPLSGGDEGPRIQELAFEADLAQAEVASVRAGLGAEVEGHVVRIRRSDFVPRADLFIEITRAEQPAATTAWRASHVAPARDPRQGAMPDEQELDYLYVPLRLPDSVFGEVSAGLDLVIVVDVSAGTEPAALELGRSVAESLAVHLGENDRVAVLASDVALRPLAGEGTLGPATSARMDGVLDALAREPAGGATDLGAVLARAAALLDPARHGAVVYVGDGAPTVGELGADALLEQLARLPHPVRAYGVALGQEGNLDLLDAITRGGGLALRVEGRAAAAEAALKILAHARLPSAQRVTVTLEGVEQVFPRSAVDVVRGAVLPVVGRVEGATPSELVVKATVGGREIEERVALREQRVSDEGDLRLRWAGERLRQLLLSGGQREEIADLGVRYGLITPYTSFYVPSAAELASLGPAAQELYRDVHELRALRRERVSVPALAPSFAMLALPGCRGADAEPASAPQEETAAVSAQLAPTPEPEMAEEADSTGYARTDAPAQNRYAAEGTATATPAEPVMPAAPPAAAAPTTTSEILAREQARTEASSSGALGSLGFRGPGSGGGGGGEGRFGEADAEDRRRPMRSRRATSTPMDESERAPAPDEVAATGASIDDLLQGALAGDGVLAGVLGGSGSTTRDADQNGAMGIGRTNIDLRLRITTDATTHVRRRCSDAADLLLDGRRELWRERLQNAGTPYEWARLYREAGQQCETPRWRDRQAFLELVLARAGSIERMVDAWRAFGNDDYLRRAILRRVRTPDDLRLVRGAFGGRADDALIAQVLGRAGEGEAKIRALRQLVRQMPFRLELKKQLLEELEAQGKIAEAKRLAQQLRHDPLTDAGIRTAIGEMYLRLEDETEARRVFGEIVEFAPEDAFARRRLGDLYRAYGWHEDAYRQYLTLAALTPDDPTVSLLLAQAAAGAGRIDEALRLEQGVIAASDPSGTAGLGRVALLWSSVRYAELKQAAREANDAEKLAALDQRLRRSGVLREASGLRATLVWSHPDAGVALWASHPRLPMTRPQDLSPELGLESFDVPEPEDGTYRLEVRRRGEFRTAVDAKLVIVWREGTPEEQVRIVTARFEPGKDRLHAFTIVGDALTEVTP